MFDGATEYSLYLFPQREFDRAGIECTFADLVWIEFSVNQRNVDFWSVLDDADYEVVLSCKSTLILILSGACNNIDCLQQTSVILIAYAQLIHLLMELDFEYRGYRILFLQNLQVFC